MSFVSLSLSYIGRGHFMKSVLDTQHIGEHIDPRHRYTAKELAPHFGISRSAVYQIIYTNNIHAAGGIRDGRCQWLIPGWSALRFIRDYPDYFIRYSTYGGKPRLVRPKPYMRGKKRGRKKQSTSALRAKVYDACNLLYERNERVTVRAVRTLVHGRTENICPFVARWKAKNSGIRPVKAA